MWGHGWSAAQIAEWFDKYGAIIIEYAKLAEQTGVNAFHIGHELHTMLTNAANEPHWRRLIRQVRAVYRGNVSVAFNGNPIFDDMDRNGVPWIDDLDFIGLDCCASFPFLHFPIELLTRCKLLTCRLARLYRPQLTVTFLGSGHGR